jgi:hypothetical protein
LQQPQIFSSFGNYVSRCIAKLASRAGRRHKAEQSTSRKGPAVFKLHTAIVFAAAALASAAPAAAEDAKPAEPELYQKMVACKDIADPAQRLACYDRQVGAFAAAASSREIVIADREEVRKTRRGLFGFAAPIGRLLGLGSDEGKDGAGREEIDKLETKVARVGRTADGGWRLTFAEAGTWDQIDTRGWVMSPKVGQVAVISRGALGSYLVSVDGQRAIKMRRVN